MSFKAPYVHKDMSWLLGARGRVAASARSTNPHPGENPTKISSIIRVVANNEGAYFSFAVGEKGRRGELATGQVAS